MIKTNELIESAFNKGLDSCSSSLRAIVKTCKATLHYIREGCPGWIVILTAPNEVILGRLNKRLESLTRRLAETMPDIKIISCSQQNRVQIEVMPAGNKVKGFFIEEIEYIQFQSGQGWTYVMPMYMLKPQDQSFNVLWVQIQGILPAAKKLKLNGVSMIDEKNAIFRLEATEALTEPQYQELANTITTILDRVFNIKARVIISGH